MFQVGRALRSGEKLSSRASARTSANRVEEEAKTKELFRASNPDDRSELFFSTPPLTPNGVFVNGTIKDVDNKSLMCRQLAAKMAGISEELITNNIQKPSHVIMQNFRIYY